MSKIQDFIKKDIKTNPSLKQEYKKSEFTELTLFLYPFFEENNVID